MKCEEIFVPAPWGEIAVKVWGNRQNPPVLMFHGILDNASAFDRLIPFLPVCYCYICVDLPGHGKSTQFPAKTIIRTLDFLLVFIIITKHFKKQKYTIIGTSYGGQLAFFYALLYPERIEKLFILDAIFTPPFRPDEIKSYFRTTHDYYFSTLEGSSALPEYSYEEALQKIALHRRFGVLKLEAAKPVLDRMLIKHANGKVSMKTDQRLKFVEYPVLDVKTSLAFIKENAPAYPFVIVMSSNCVQAFKILFEDLFYFYKEYKSCRLIVVEGDHDVHNNNPERVAPLLNHFLLNKSRL